MTRHNPVVAYLTIIIILVNEYKVKKRGKKMAILEFILKNKECKIDLITRSTYHSNAIEGSTLTYAETYAILCNDNSFKYRRKRA